MSSYVYEVATVSMKANGNGTKPEAVIRITDTDGAVTEKKAAKEEAFPYRRLQSEHAGRIS